MNRKCIFGVAGLFALGLAASCGAADVREPLRVTLTFDDNLKDHLLVAAPELEARGWRGTFNVITDKIGSDGKYMTWDDVRELVRRGHEVTTHCKTHPHLVDMLKAGKVDEVRREIAESRDAIADRTGFAPRYMCSPYCQQNDETERICREEGLRQMLLCRHNFGEGCEDAVAEVVAQVTAAGNRRLDILHHGITAAGGGWRPFKDRASFARHLDSIARLEKEGKVIVTDYDGMASDCALKAKAWPRHGVIALSFDDKHLEGWTKALPLFRKYGATTTFCMAGAIGSNEIAFVRRAMAEGHELALHGQRHMNADAECAKLGAEKYWQVEMAPQLAACKAAGIPVRSFAYPNCRHNAETDALFFKHGFTRVRGSILGVKGPQPHDPKGEKLDQWKPLVTFDPMYSPAVSYLTERNIANVIMGESYHTDIADILASMKRAGERGELLSIVSHGIAPDAKRINMKTEWLERMLAAANDFGVIVRGLR